MKKYYSGLGAGFPTGPQSGAPGNTPTTQYGQPLGVVYGLVLPPPPPGLFWAPGHGREGGFGLVKAPPGKGVRPLLPCFPRS